jgi:hypothetical protein
MNVTDLIKVLQEISDPDETLVVLSENEIDEPCEFVALDDLLAASD